MNFTNSPYDRMMKEVPNYENVKQQTVSVIKEPVALTQSR